jgi:hypothetical protein
MPSFQRMEVYDRKQFILLVFMSGCETGYLTLRKKLKLQVSENRGNYLYLRWRK